MLTGKHLIDGEWRDGPSTFRSDPASGPASGEGRDFAVATPALVDEAARAAEDAFATYALTSRAERAAFLRRVADEIDARGGEITEVGSQETGLPEARLNGERGRTVGQLRLFADHIEEGSYLDRRHDEALPDRSPLPRPDLRLVQRPVGPVAVFGASNFPLAFSVAGGDTASALAAGCPVIVKGHPAHPGTGELVAQAIHAAREVSGLHPGVFALLQGDAHEVGAALVQHPLVAAVGFTGSLRGGRALFDLCARRAVPIPFYGELGSINPVFLLPGALSARAAQIGEGWAGSLTMGAGQFCTNPGAVVLVDGPDADAFEEAALGALRESAPQVMLTDAIARAYREGAERMRGQPGVEAKMGESRADRTATPHMLTTDGDTWLASPELHREVFGPLGIVVRVRDEAQMMEVARAMEGQLTVSLHIEEADHGFAARLLPTLERKAGRLLVGGFPTGVEVSDAMVHGGPYPASTNFGHTSVGTLAIRRFLRPVCYQDVPEGLIADRVA